MRRRSVASQTFGIIGRVFADNVVMRIVAGETTDARIRSVEAPAVGQPIGLESYVDLAMKVASHYRLPRAMTLATEIRDILGRQFPKFRRRGGEISLQ